MQLFQTFNFCTNAVILKQNVEFTSTLTSSTFESKLFLKFATVAEGIKNGLGLK